MLFSVVLALTAAGSASTLGPAAPLPADASMVGRLDKNTPSGIAVTLHTRNPDALRQLILDQTKVGSNSYHRWLTPEGFGEQFGQPSALLDRAASWLRRAGLSVELAPNRLFLKATGPVSAVERAFGIQLWKAVRSSGETFRTYVGQPKVPLDLASEILYVSGIDTRLRAHASFDLSGGCTFGPADLQLFYDAATLQGQGHKGNGTTAAVIGAQEDSTGVVAGDVTNYFSSVSNASAMFVDDVLPNPNSDFQGGVNLETETDAEMESIGAPAATSITIVEAPASEIFTTGAQYIVNSLPTTTVVSSSFGQCEPLLPANYAAAFEQIVQQGNSEGQTWFAGSGDQGANGCEGEDGEPPAATVQFPASLPEVTAVGGSEPPSTANDFDSSCNSTGDVQEVVWNDSGGAGGGGISTLFTKPPWQASDGFGPPDAGRDVPDFALLAGNPGVVCENSGTPGTLSDNGGTSVASPLAAGFFAMIAEISGGSLGQINPELYALGTSHPSVFHDITSGTNSYGTVTGYSASAGYDLATGWGTLDVGALAQVWPMCVPRECDAGYCGTVSDSCGGTLSCGDDCAAPQTCGGGGNAEMCGCTPVQCGSTSCGNPPDGCGGMLNCGTCFGTQTCGGGGTPFECGCPPLSCTGMCGDLFDDCGNTLECPLTCPSPYSCEGTVCTLPDGGTLLQPDAGVDAGVPDAGPGDAGPDAGVDAGIGDGGPQDAGVRPPTDGGALPTDGGADSGTVVPLDGGLDDGGIDAGQLADGGDLATATTRGTEVGVGCGCTTGSPSTTCFAVLALALLRRRRRAEQLANCGS